MGYDSYIKLKPDGIWEEVESGYLTFKTFGDMTVKIDQYAPPFPGNLFVKYAGGEYRAVGDPAYLYGWDWSIDHSSPYGTVGGTTSRDIYVADQRIFVMAFNMEKDTDFSRIHQVDLATNETTRVSDLPTAFFTVDGEFIYYASAGKLYKAPVKGGAEELIETAGPVSQDIGFQVMGGKVYYVNSSDGRIYATGTDNSLNQGGRATMIHRDENFIICEFAETKNSYCMIIYARNGKPVFKTSDTAANALIDNGKLYYTVPGSNSIYTKQLAGID